MSFHAYIERDFVGASYLVWLVERIGPATFIHTHDDRRVVHDPNAIRDSNDFFCRIPSEAAHQFLGELARALGAVEHPEQLRRDFEHERGRVDKLIDQVFELAYRRSTP